MTTDERLAHLLEHGVGCPQAVKLGGPSAVEAWCEQQELTLEAEIADAEDAEAVAAAAAETAAEEAEAATEAAEARAAAALAEAEAAGPVEVTTDGPGDAPEGAAPVGDMSAAIPSILDRLDALESAVDALAVSGPPVEAVEAVAASSEPEPKGKKKGKKKAGAK